MLPHERIILSLDGFSDIEAALVAVKEIGVTGTIVKMNDLCDRYGVQAVKVFRDEGFLPFADMKILDIPDTAARRTAQWRAAGAKFLTVHASGHDKMMKACVEAAGDDMKILAVTVLTSFNHTASMHVFGRAPQHMVHEFAFSAARSGVHGIVASLQEVAELRANAVRCNGASCPRLIVTPGVRPLWAAKNDQERVATPAEAIRAGADYLVIGRPIFKPSPEIGTPYDAFQRIVHEIAPFCG